MKNARLSYKNHFHLASLPFENVPDPAFVFMGKTFRDALALLIHAITSRKGMMCVTGSVGCGKTTLASVLTRHLPDHTFVIPLLHPRNDPQTFRRIVVRGIKKNLVEIAGDCPIHSAREALLKINDEGGICLLIVDEAQLLTDEMFNELLILSNLETPSHKLMQILLLGQNELLHVLRRPQLRQLRQRLAVACSLEAMNRGQAFHYIAHRLKIAGAPEQIFANQSLEKIVCHSGGIPRLINKLCDASMLQAFLSQNQNVTEYHVADAIQYLEIDAQNSIKQDLIPEPTISDDQYIPSDTPIGEKDGVNRNEILNNERRNRSRFWMAASFLTGVFLAVFSVMVMEYNGPFFKTFADKELSTAESSANTKDKSGNQSDSANKKEIFSENATMVLKNDVVESGYPATVSNAESVMQFYPYSVRLASFKSRLTAKKSLQFYKKAGMFPYWVKMDMGKSGVWFGIFSNNFTTFEQAKQFVADFRLQNAVVAKTPYAALIGKFQAENAMQRVAERLEQKGYSFYSIDKSDGKHYLYVGAYFSEESASNLCKDLASDGFDCQFGFR